MQERIVYPNKPSNTRHKAVATILTLLAVLIISGSVSAYNQKHASNRASTAIPATTASNSTSGTTNQPSVAPSTSNSNNMGMSGMGSSSFKDGTYTASSNYFVPSGNESIKVTLTVQNGMVTNSKVVNSENDRESAFYQEEFASSYKSEVVGKKLSNINLSYVAGASDTTQGFNDALDQIRNQAQA